MARARQERAEITRQAILDGAAIAFDRTGFHGTSLTDVVGHAGVTKGALYFHFSSKEALAQTLMDEQFQVSEGLPAIVEPGLQTAIDLTHRMACGLRSNVRIRAGIRLVIEFGSFTDPDPSPYNAWIDTCHGILVPAQERGDVLPSVDAYDAATMIVGAFTGIQLTSHVRTRREDLHARVVDLWNFLLPGIVPAERISRFDPAGSPECRSELGLSAPDSSAVTAG
ncbi:ScbR family autoregulator-binding transcription factor [Streptomyces sp. NPDC002812]|uniref:ScbR family autoregulator-binding transcription factor n=1 Tax=unclassified Streptomyces TaxID=2593676 RepID=UPI00203016FD|nr:MULTISPECIES: ScbR family autoregulator-binding transcription factor [unclassified Streptomyces]MCM1970653.1 TetR/AcrR family transcriptional regulator [Streptomyces sp. G1]MCX5130462.1 ScbR family autoregulator-binding transcription factor [Streptomyces sp. NBC_00347]MCX5301843.1 ScbR family autoregulator-binding transcription factor [Streptomyces sp. NBC_00193]